MNMITIDELIGYLMGIASKYPKQKKNSKRYIKFLERLKDNHGGNVGDK